jgi:hypothetical protein
MTASEKTLKMKQFKCFCPTHACTIPSQSQTRHIHTTYEVCLIMGDGGNGAVSGFVLRPLSGPGSPYFQSSYPCLIVGAVS